MIEVYIDGASAGDPGPSGVGVLIKTPMGTTEEYAIPIEPTNNHTAEFRALVEAMKLCLSKNYLTVSVRTDSQLVDQVHDRHYVKNKSFQPYLNEIIKLESQFDLFFVKWIPSHQNKKADQLARSALRAAMKKTPGGTVHEP